MKLSTSPCSFFFLHQIQISTMLFRSQFLHFHLSVTNQDLQCWRLWMKLSTSPCSRSIASIMLPRSGQSKQVLILLVFFSTLYSVLFLNSFSSYLKEVWIVSSTCSIASFTCKWNYKYLTKNCHVKKKDGYHGTPNGDCVMCIKYY